MTYQIYQWDDIKDQFVEGTLLIGNGASVALDPQFSYTSLKEYAEHNDKLDADILKLFREFDTNDFEYILRLVWHASIINNKLKIEDDRTQKAYENIRDALIHSVRAIHSDYDQIKENLPNLYEFTKKFKKIISLNYDLILYWIMMHGNDQRDGHKFKDCFKDGIFQMDWRKFGHPIWGERDVTLVFYPHGSLSLARDIYDEEYKISTNGSNLLESILNTWQSGNAVPLFISEGTAEKKLNSILSSRYLRTVYDEVLSSIFLSLSSKNNLVIYGWALGEHDIHILKRILCGRHHPRQANKPNNKIAISLYKPTQDDCFRIEQTIKKILNVSELNLELYFFDSASSGCWNNPTTPPENP
ncbi:DUF4917 domain-containing protein [Acinetobacter pittii]|uniref:DUF4917 family protein n=1 Tax=Acinetobacter TaxID=469 RepID=UPI00044B9009|nr:MULTISPECIES: DUF4917 family protein [Acinetobacter calcoaceticus/baumannii complex]EXG33066.1 hypothetical protein J733_0930 [Acinetobacter sp. 263903-2]OTS02612.1 DUF4917 domain-containing protein [Acinetobacter pittii]